MLTFRQPYYCWVSADQLVTVESGQVVCDRLILKRCHTELERLQWRLMMTLVMMPVICRSNLQPLKTTVMQQRLSQTVVLVLLWAVLLIMVQLLQFVLMTNGIQCAVLGTGNFESLCKFLFLMPWFMRSRHFALTVISSIFSFFVDHNVPRL